MSVLLEGASDECLTKTSFQAAATILTAGGWIRPRSTPGAGTIELWWDDQVMMSWIGSDPSNDAYQKVFTGSGAQFGRDIEYPSTLNGGPKVPGMKLYYDNVRLYHGAAA